MRAYRPTYKTKTGETRQIKKWWVEVRDHLEIQRQFAGFSDKRQTEALGRRIEALVACRVSRERPSGDLAHWLEVIPDKLRGKLLKFGILERGKAAAGQNLAQHLNDFYESLEDKGTSQKQADLVKARVKRIIDGCEFKTWSDIQASRVSSFLADLRKDRIIRKKDKKGVTHEKVKRGLSAQTYNFYIQAMKQFCRWVVQDRRAVESPVAHLQGMNVKTDRRHDRKALEVDQARRLLETTAAAEHRYGMDGYERSFLYRMAMETALRSNELRSLRKQSIDFDECTVTVQAAYSKHRREDVVPLRPATVEDLKELLKNKVPQSPIFKMPHENKVCGMLQADLAEAGIPYRDDTDRFSDFHSLRHCCGSYLAAAGVHPTVAMAIMRYSKIDLSMSVYTHMLTGQEAKAVDALPDLTKPSKQSQRAQATGTDGEIAPDCGVVTQKRHEESDLLSYLSEMCGEQRTTADGSGLKAGERRSAKTSMNGSLSGKIAVSGMGMKKAAAGFEPANNGFANRRLRPLGYAAEKSAW